MPKTVSTTYPIKEAQERLKHLAPEGKFTTSIKSFGLDTCFYICHLVAVSRGWWHDKDGVTPLDRNIGEMIALIHSEVSEGLEAVRKNLQSDHITDFTGFEEEMCDAVIRIGDLYWAMADNPEDAFFAKLEFNMRRKDHSIAARSGENGKQF